MMRNVQKLNQLVVLLLINTVKIEVKSEKMISILWILPLIQIFQGNDSFLFVWARKSVFVGTKVAVQVCCHKSSSSVTLLHFRHSIQLTIKKIPHFPEILIMLECSFYRNRVQTDLKAFHKNSIILISDYFWDYSLQISNVNSYSLEYFPLITYNFLYNLLLNVKFNIIHFECRIIKSLVALIFQYWNIMVENFFRIS